MSHEHRVQNLLSSGSKHDELYCITLK